MAKLKNPTRRGFLGFMAAAPVAAKGAAKEAAMKLTGANVGMAGVHDPSIRLGVPDWLKKQIKKETSYVREIHPDIAALRSVSVSGMFRMQRQYQFRSGIRRVQGYASGEEEQWEEMRKKLAEETGFWF